MALGRNKSVKDKAVGYASGYADGAASSAKAGAASAGKSARKAAKSARKQAGPQLSHAYAVASDFVEHTALPALSDAASHAADALSDARDKAGPVLADARERAVPVLIDARDRAVPVLQDARDKAAPVVAAGAAAASKKAVEARDLALAKAGKAPKKSHKKRNLLLFAAVAGAVGFAAKKVMSPKESENWQTSYVPTNPPAPAPTPAYEPPPTSSDAAAAAPDEVVADSGELPVEPTTPDAPAEVIPIDGAAPEDEPTS